MLVSLVFLSGARQKAEVVTVRLMNMAGTRGTDEKNLKKDTEDGYKSATITVPQPCFLDEKTCGIMLYVDLFCGNLKKLTDKIRYFKSLGINYVHLMPLFKCPKKENDGGYAISSYRMVEERLGTIEDLRLVANEFHKNGIRLVLDFVFNHTSDEHQRAIKAKEGDAEFQNYYYMYDNKKKLMNGILLCGKFFQTYEGALLHTLIQCFQYVAKIVCPSLLFKSEAIVHPDEVVKYIGQNECRLSYNPLQMALFWSTLASRDTRLLTESLKKR